MTGSPKPPKPALNLYERIRAKVEPLGGIDLDLPPREPGREPPCFDDMSFDAPESITDEVTSPASKENASEAGEHMRHEDFQIGGVFWCGGRQWRCTDIGTRVITAIRLDHVDVASTAPERRRTLDRSEAEAEGWFNGPPYAVNEVVFDEYDIEGCSLESEPDDDALCSSRPDARTGADPADVWDSPESNARQMAQAKSLRDQARAGSLRFEAYLPSRLADWLLAHIECGNFRDPSEAVFVMLGEQQELEPHADLRREFFKRRIQAGIDSGPGVPAEEVFERLRKSLAEPRSEPALWRKLP